MMGRKLTSLEISMLNDAKDHGVFSTEFKGKRICLTGTMSLDRKDVARVITLAGGTWDENMKPGTHFLVVGDTGAHGVTAKLSQARTLGVTILDENEFAQRLTAVPVS